MDGLRSRRRLVDASGLLDAQFVGRQYGCLTIATRTTVKRKSSFLVDVVCSKCGETSQAVFHKIERRVPRGCRLCMRHFGENCPEWVYRRAQKQWRRCNDPKTICYERYGGRGIKFNFPSVWDAACWIVANLGVPENRKLQLDRIDNNGHYEAGNLRWATASQNVLNRSLSHNSRVRQFIIRNPTVGYTREHLHRLFNQGLTEIQIAARWNRKYGISSTADHETATLQTA